jgi:hypothetical protein
MPKNRKLRRISSVCWPFKDLVRLLSFVGAAFALSANQGYWIGFPFKKGIGAPMSQVGLALP